jgi:phospholipase/carboxylesterase
MVLQLMRHRPTEFAYGVQLGGFVVNDGQPRDDELAGIRPPLFWGRGAHDSVISPSAIARTSHFSSTHFQLSERIYNDLGHDVAGQEVRELSRFLADVTS